uniref:PAZ domain-containing protein n=2 Tax=Haemonchus contortus TaxID=6289 RepID=A0A7I4XS84_HAECO
NLRHQLGNMADQLGAGMKQLSVSTVALPEKRDPGSRGTKTEYLTNLTNINLKPNVPFYKYDVRMYIVYKGNDGREHLKELTKQTKDDFPEQERKIAAVGVFKYMCKNYKDVFPNDGALFYDRAAVLFSAQNELKLGGQERTLSIKPTANLVPAAGKDAAEVRVVIKKVTEGYQVTSNDLIKAVNIRDCERDKGMLEVLNIALSQKGYLETSQFVTYGTGVHYLFDHRALGFRDNELPSLMDGKYMGIGLTKSVKVLEGDGKKGSAYVVTDVTKGAFHIDEQSLLEKISQMSIFFDPRRGQSTFNVQAAMQPFNMKSILQLIKGLYVRTIYGKKKCFPIGNIASPANQISFETESGKATVEQYFKKHYNIQLKYPTLFTVSERHNPSTYYPVELLVVAPSQRVTLQQQTPDQVASMIKASATLPAVRIQQTKVMKDALGITSGNAKLSSAGISVEDSFTKVPGRVLPAPTIIYGGNQGIRPKDNCKWNGDQSKFIEPAQLTNWAVCATLTQNDSRRLKIGDYIARVEARCRLRGMQVERAAEIFDLKKQTFEGLREFYAAQKQKDRKYLMFITSDSIKQHDYIKLLEVEYQIVSQEVKGSKVDSVMFKNQNQTLDNVIAKINMKLGGVNYVVSLGPRMDDPVSKWLNDEARLFVGFEISNPPALSKMEIERGATYKMPSVLGWGANCAANPQHYLGDYKFIKARQSDMMGATLGELIVEILKKFKAATSRAPRHIVLYFSGISEGQFSLVTDTYVRAIRTGIKSLSEAYNPNVTALAVSKDHNERLYKSKIVGERATDQNIPPGTVVDTKIVSPVINEFYLNAHSAFQGTAKTPKYSLLADDSNIPLDVIESMTHGLCYLHEIVTSTVSVPVPLIVADRCAKRGHNIFIANSGQGKAAVSSIEEANERLTNHGELQKVRYNA